MGHFARRKAKRPGTSKTRWDHDTLGAATDLSADGAFLARAGARFGVHASTVACRFNHAGVQIRPRRGWTA